MGKQQRQQGHDFEACVSTALHDLRRAGKLRMVHKFVNCVGTPADFLVAGQFMSHMIECKSLVEGKSRNKAYSLRLSCITANEWAGMEAWRWAGRAYWVVWRMQHIDGAVYTYAAPGWLLLQAKMNGVKHLRVDVAGVHVIGSGNELDILKPLAWREARETGENT